MIDRLGVSVDSLITKKLNDVIEEVNRLARVVKTLDYQLEVARTHIEQLEDSRPQRIVDRRFDPPRRVTSVETVTHFSDGTFQTRKTDH